MFKLEGDEEHTGDHDRCQIVEVVSSCGGPSDWFDEHLEDLEHNPQRGNPKEKEVDVSEPRELFRLHTVAVHNTGAPGGGGLSMQRHWRSMGDRRLV